MWYFANEHLNATMETERSSKYRQPKGSFNKRENLVPQFNLEDIESQNLKRSFFIWERPVNFHVDNSIFGQMIR